MELIRQALLGSYRHSQVAAGGSSNVEQAACVLGGSCQGVKSVKGGLDNLGIAQQCWNASAPRSAL